MERCTATRILAKKVEWNSLLPPVPGSAKVGALDGSQCRGSTRAGVASDASGVCIDVGVGHDDEAAMRRPAWQRWHQLQFLPRDNALKEKTAARLGRVLHGALERLNFGACAHALVIEQPPLIGFGAALEHVFAFLSRGLAADAPLALGVRAHEAWTSERFCGAERSFHCYFNMSGCCVGVDTSGATVPARAAGRRGRRGGKQFGGLGRASLVLAGYDGFGGAWLSGQLARYLFDRLTPNSRRELDARTVALWPPGWRGGGGVIGMHIRRGDSCSLGSRYCPANLTSGYFEHALAFRQRYATRLDLAPLRRNRCIVWWWSLQVHAASCSAPS
jgi:hypothetical protein